jgi:hypothetical protein
MTSLITKTIRNASLALAFAVSLSAISSTSSFAFSDAEKAACQGDAYRICASEIPNISRTVACMVRNKDKVSPGCRAYIDAGLASKGSKVAAK